MYRLNIYKRYENGKHYFWGFYDGSFDDCIFHLRQFIDLHTVDLDKFEFNLFLL